MRRKDKKNKGQRLKGRSWMRKKEERHGDWRVVEDKRERVITRTSHDARFVHILLVTHTSDIRKRDAPIYPFNTATS